ncbi:hypothetical protein F2Q68_00036456 [Brassica cretica]|uniref:Uncharacterized protein n=2 Tax=Brassica cretica TaxID=69181 RepID=A0A8S9HAW3_BRACR|nr:hypothetical protein F2Q68_00036456 [Brassica cretica]KAF3595756.1 hypothetical protein DY000_02025573 [Brassica cretica]
MFRWEPDTRIWDGYHVIHKDKICDTCLATELDLWPRRINLEGQTDPDRADILWKASSVMNLVVTVLQQCCLECLVNPTVRSSLIELKFGRGVVDWFILDLYGGISLWLPESL